MEPAGEIEPHDDATAFAPTAAQGNRRSRFSKKKQRGGPTLPPKMHSWLIRTTRIHAALCYCARVFAKPPADTPGDTVEARAARRDRTLLYDFWAHAINELTELQNELAADMEPTASVPHRPGSPEKVEALAARAACLQSLFRDDDARL